MMNFLLSLQETGSNLQNCLKTKIVFSSRHALAIEHILKLPFPVYFEDADHVTQVCNEICAEECGFDSLQDCIGKPWFQPFNPKSVIQSLINDKTVVKNNQYKIVEEFAVRKDNTPVHTFSIRMPWYNLENKIIGLFGCSILLGKQSLCHALSLIKELGLLNHPYLAPFEGLEIIIIFFQKEK